MMRFRFIGFSCSFLLCLGFNGAAYATPALDEAIQQAEQIERERAERGRAREMLHLQRLYQTLKVTPEQIKPARRAPVADRCVQINEIEVSGNSLINNEVLNKALGEYQGTCLGLPKLNEVLKKATFAYIKAGYIASRAYLPEQDLSTGVLKILIVEGSLEKISFEKNLSAGANAASQLFPGLVGKPVNLRDLEQGLDQINRLRSKTVKTDMRAGSEAGDTHVVIRGEQRKKWYVTLDTDNLGNRATGQYQSGASLVLEDLLQLHEQVSFRYQRGASQHPFTFAKTRPVTERVEASFSIPYGSWLLRLQASGSRYFSKLVGNISPIQTSGHSTGISATLSNVVHRARSSKTILEGSLGWKMSKNYVLGSLIDTTSRNITTGGIKLIHSRMMLGGAGSLSIGYERGLDFFGAASDEEKTSQEPLAQFDKISFSASFYRPFSLGPIPMKYDGQLSGQWGFNHLYGSEQMALGGLGSIRGVESALLAGNTGFRFRNEVSTNLPEFGNPLLQKSIGVLEPYAALDFGHILAEPKLDIGGGTVVGSALGLRSSGGSLSFDVSWGSILSAPSDIRFDRGGVVYARSSLSF